MMSNNAGDQIAPAAQAAVDKGITVVTWDSPIPSAKGEQVFVAQVDFNDMGKTMAQMALDIIGPDGGKFAVLSASPDAANQNAWIAAMNEALKDPEYPSSIWWRRCMGTTNRKNPPSKRWRWWTNILI